MTDKELEAIEERAAKATAPPWVADLDVYDPDDPEICAGVSNAEVDILFTAGVGVRNRTPEAWERARSSQPLRDAEFMAAARSDVPQLIAEVRRLRKALRRELDACFCDDRDGNNNPPHLPQCDRCERIRAVLGAST